MMLLSASLGIYGAPSEATSFEQIAVSDGVVSDKVIPRILQARNRPSDTTGSDDLDAAGLGPLLSLYDIEFNLHALLDDGATQIVGVDEYVLAAALGRDESKTLCNVEELDRAFLHVPVSLPRLPI